MDNNAELAETIKKFLIVGETLDEIFSYNELKTKNILISIVFFISTTFSFIQATTESSFWILLTISFLIGTIYYTINSKTTIIYSITKYRIIKLERNLYTKYIFKSNDLYGYIDLHFEHVESINIGVPALKIPSIYLSIFGISIGWLILDSIGKVILLPSIFNFFRLIAFFMISFSVLSLLLLLPIGGSKLIIQSISGKTMILPKKVSPDKFISKLLINCRNFLTYGTE